VYVSGTHPKSLIYLNFLLTGWKKATVKLPFAASVC